MRTFACQRCGTEVERNDLAMRSTKRFCDACLRAKRLDTARKRRAAAPPREWTGRCPDCGARTSKEGRYCSKHGRALAGKTKTASTRERNAAEKRAMTVLLRDFARRHGNRGPSMREWDELGYPWSAHRVLRVFGGWNRALEEVGAETNPHELPMVKLGKNRQMVTGGQMGAKPRGEAPAMDRAIPFI